MRNSFMSGGRSGLTGVRSFRQSLRQAPTALKRLLRFQPDGFFTNCQLSYTTLDTWRPIDSIDGTFLFCSQDINQFDRTT